jgi:hypothetical protein
MPFVPHQSWVDCIMSIRWCPLACNCVIADDRDSHRAAKHRLALAHEPARSRSMLRDRHLAFLTGMTRKVLPMADFISKPMISAHGERVLERGSAEIGAQLRRKLSCI